MDRTPRIVVYGSDPCSACRQAKHVLARHGHPFTSRPISELPARYQPVRTMPQITVDDELVGGLTDLLRVARRVGLDHLGQPEARIVTVRRRLGRGHDVMTRDHLGRELSRERVASREQAAALRPSQWPGL